MSIIIAIILGLIQGLTEFIPVSSSGHLELAGHVLAVRGDDFHYLLEVINFGTLLVLFIFYRQRIAKILNDVFKKKDYKFALNIILTCIPAGLSGLLLSKVIDNLPFIGSLWTICISMAVVGLIMVFLDMFPHQKEKKDETKLTPKNALAIGFAQVFALIPGVSRSGSTIIAGRLCGLKNKAAADYSFLVSIPLMCAVCLKTLASSSTRAFIFDNLPLVLVGNLVAFIAGLLVIKPIMNFFKRDDSVKIFGIYRVCLAAVLAVVLLLQL